MSTQLKFNDTFLYKVLQHYKEIYKNTNLYTLILSLPWLAITVILSLLLIILIDSFFAMKRAFTGD